MMLRQPSPSPRGQRQNEVKGEWSRISLQESRGFEISGSLARRSFAYAKRALAIFRWALRPGRRAMSSAWCKALG